MHRVFHKGLLFTGLLITPHFLMAQSSAIPPTASSAETLATILTKAEVNIETYRSNVPNVYCTEHAVAKRKIGNSATDWGMAVPGGSAPLEHSATVENTAETTSTFRLRKLEEPSDKGIFDESRILQKVTYSVDAPGYEEIAIPELLYGVFSNGLNILSRKSRNCFQFDLKKHQPGKPIIIDFTDLPAAQRAQECPATSDGKGSIQIDPATMHVMEIERKLPRHTLVGSIEGSWEWKERYAPVVLKGATFWLPISIVSRSVSTDQKRIWTYSATYTDYHLFYTSTRIVPGPGL